jgi:hypothetical protein
MAFSAEQLDRWEAWLMAERAYAVTKFPADEQVRYFEQGVTVGPFSWRNSILGYMLRAALGSQNGRPLAGRSLRMVQETGKSAHNLATLAATGRVVLLGANDMSEGFSTVVGELRHALANQAVDPILPTEVVVADQKAAFADLQVIQNEGAPESFDARVMGMNLPVHAGFITLAEAYGWPQPGLSSTQDVQPWAAAARQA